MTEAYTNQLAIIDQGRRVEFPLNKSVVIHGLLVEFNFESKEFSFHEVHLSEDRLKVLVPGIEVPENIGFNLAIAIERNRLPLAAIVFGTESKNNNRPVRAVYNLTRPGDLRVIVLNGAPKPFENAPLIDRIK